MTLTILQAARFGVLGMRTPGFEEWLVIASIPVIILVLFGKTLLDRFFKK